MTADPFGTADLRSAVLAAWSAHPARFREDANAEEDHAHGYYRDRVVVELAQNAADAAARADQPGRLLLRLRTTPDGGRLLAANTGAPLDADGVASLASLRASAKRDTGVVGRFGVGFAAVRSVADEITVASTTGAVHFSLAATTAELGGADPDLAAEVERRGGSLPILRLPLPGPGPGGPASPPEGWDTAVELHLRDAGAVEQVRTQLAAVGDALLLALPAVSEVEIDVDGEQRAVRAVASRWVVATRTGRLDPALLADRPVEERDRDGWQVTWAVPRVPAQETAVGAPSPFRSVIHAPTPTDEPCTVPALLIATLPLDPSRRHVSPGPLTDTLVEHAGVVWADLLAACRDEPPSGDDVRRGVRGRAPDPLDLLPERLPAGALDAALRDAVVDATRQVPLFRPVGGGPALTASASVVLDGPVPPSAQAALGPWVPDLVDLSPRHRRLVALLGLATAELSDVVDALPFTEPERHRALYEAFDGADSRTLEQLATLPVPLVDGRTVRGARGLVIAAPDVPEALLSALTAWGLRTVHPEAAHPLLERLGAERLDVAGLLHHPVVRGQVLAAASTLASDAATESDEDDAVEVTDVVLGLVAAALAAGDPLDAEPWWSEVLLPAADGELLPARGLVLPGSRAATWFDPAVLPPVAQERVVRWGDALGAVGVRTGLTVVRIGDDEATDDGGESDWSLVTQGLDGWDEYVDDLQVRLPPGDLPECVAVSDLDAVRPDAWPEVLQELARGEARHVLVEPVRVGTVRAPSYTAWWLRHRSGLGVDRPFALPGGHAALAPLLGPVPDILAAVDVEVLAVLGGTREPADLDLAGWEDLLDALPPAGSPFPVEGAVAVWRGLGALAHRDEADGVLDPDRLPALTADGVAVVPIEDVAVASPMWAQHPGVRPVVVVPAEVAGVVADLLDVDLAAERRPGRVTSDGPPAATPDVVRAVFPGVPATWFEHDDLAVDGEPVDWWVTDDGDPAVFAATTAGLARALAACVGWGHRDTLERLLMRPEDVDAVLLESAGDVVDPVGEHRGGTAAQDR